MRKRDLPPGWYPATGHEISDLIQVWKPDFPDRTGQLAMKAGVVPHAGWAYCGSMIASVLDSWPGVPETVVVLGGHNGSGGPLISYEESSWEFPGGIIHRNSELAQQVNKGCDRIYKIVNETGVDNTVEVVMAMAASLYPTVKWCGWRIPADNRSIEFGKILHEFVSQSGTAVLVTGSTDLTHYGPDFGFTPAESQNNPRGWAEKTDRHYIRLLQDLNGKAALEMAETRRSACSTGGAVAAASYAAADGAVSGRLLEYRSSLDIQPASSFVGYASILWE